MVQAISEVSFDRDQFIQKLRAAGITQEEIQTAKSQGPSAFKQLLEAHGIQAPSAPPSRGNGNNEQFIQKLKALGIPESVIKQGPEAVKQYAQQNNIQLPEPPKRSSESNHSGHKAEFQAKVEQYMKQHQGVTEQEAVQAVMAEFKAKQTALEIQNKSN